MSSPTISHQKQVEDTTLKCRSKFINYFLEIKLMWVQTRLGHIANITQKEILYPLMKTVSNTIPN